MKMDNSVITCVFPLLTKYLTDQLTNFDETFRVSPILLVIDYSNKAKAITVILTDTELNLMWL